MQCAERHARFVLGPHTRVAATVSIAQHRSKVTAGVPRAQVQASARRALMPDTSFNPATALTSASLLTRMLFINTITEGHPQQWTDLTSLATWHTLQLVASLSAKRATIQRSNLKE
jgi:hypothetical protein